MTIPKTSTIHASCVLALACAAAPALADTGLTGFMGTDGQWYVYDSVLGVTWKGNTGHSGDIGYISWQIASATWFGLPAGSWHMGHLDFVDSVHDRICGDANPDCGAVWSTSFGTWATHLGGFLGPPYPHPPVNSDWVYNFRTGVGFTQWGGNHSAMSYYIGNLMNPPIPEPATTTMLLAGLMVLVAARRR